MLPLLAFVVAVLFLLPRSAPGLTFEDAGELAAAADCWGVAHPPGYPLLTLLGGLATRLGSLFGLDPARSMVLLSVASAALACALLVRFLERARCWRAGGLATDLAPAPAAAPVAALIGGLLPLFAPTFRAQALVVEAYALAAACAAALLLASICAGPLTIGFLWGLAMAAHPSALFLFPLAVFGVLRAASLGLGRRRSFGRAGIGLVLGLSLYLYVPLAAAFDPALDWGGISNLGELIDHLLRRQFGTTPERDLAAQAGFLAEHLIGQWPLVIGLALVAGGVLRRRAKHTPSAEAGRDLTGLSLTLVGATLVVTTLGLFWAQHWPVEEQIARVRLAGSFTPLVLLAAAGSGLLLGRLEERLAERFGRRHRIPSVLVLVLLASVHVAPDGRATLADFQDMRAVTEAEAFAREVLEGAASGDVVVINRLGYSDVLFFPLLYGQIVLGLGEEVTLIDRELLGAPWYRAQLAAARPELAAALEELGTAIELAPGGPRERRLTQVPFLRWLAARPGGVALIGRPGARITEGLELTADDLFWWLAAPGDARGATGGRPVNSQRSRPYLNASADYDPWRAELRREARERDRFRAAALAGRDPAAVQRLSW